MALNSEGYDGVAQHSPSEHAIELPSLDCDTVLRDEAKQLLSLAGPFILTYIMGYLPGIVALSLVGHIDSPKVQLYIGAASLGDMYFNVTGYSTGLGIASAMDTLCSHAFGAGNTQRIGIVLQTGIFVLASVFIPVMLLNIFAADILDDASMLAEKYTQCLIVGLPFLYTYELLKKSLQAQNVAAPMIYCAIVCNCVNFIVGYYLIYYAEMGFLGAALGRTVANISLPFCLIPYYWRSPEARLIWPGLQIKAALKGVGEFLRCGVPGMLMMMFEWCSFECIAILSGLLPTPIISLGANAITLNMYAILDWMYYGIAVSTTVRVGNAIGAKDIQRARIAVKAAILATLILAGICILVLLIARQQYPYIFTNDTTIARMASNVAQIVILFQIPQAINQTTQGILRGCGLQHLGALINFIAYLLIGLPLGYSLAFLSGMNLSGLWMGMVIAFVTAATIGLAIVQCTNFDRICEKSSAKA